MPRRYGNEHYSNVTVGSDLWCTVSGTKKTEVTRGMLPTGNAKPKSALRARRWAQFQGFPEAPCLDLGALAALSSKLIAAAGGQRTSHRLRAAVTAAGYRTGLRGRT